MEGIKLRKATDDDLDFLYTLHKATLKEHVEQTWGWDEEWQKSRFEQHFNPEKVQIIMLDNISIGELSVEHTDCSIFLNTIEILPEYQDKGIGTYLIEEILAKAEHENKSVALQVLKVNERARTLYKRLGFSIRRETETHYNMTYRRRK
jgi:ribosomal protein S18 acetylase RimI-like enzyme